MQTWRLDHGDQTLILAQPAKGIAHVVYWGSQLAADVCLNTIAAACKRDVTGGMMDAHTPITLCPVAGDAYPGQPGLLATDTQGQSLYPCFSLSQADCTETQLLLVYTDDHLGLTYKAVIAATDTADVWCLRASLTSSSKINVHWLAAPVLPVADHLDRLLDYGGRWLREFQPHTSSWGASAQVRENPTGRTGHEHFPGLLATNQGCTYTQGQVCVWHYAWSGGHKMVAEQLPDGRKLVQFGHVTGSYSGLGTHFETAPLYVSYSSQGINGVSVPLQRLVKYSLLPTGFVNKPRPVHYNCWEAVYFDHNLANLKALASRAASLGAERFVLDDGWFGQRNNDATSLGDWTVNQDKYPHGLHPLIAYIHAQGMGFGLWLEPEMINQDADLFRQHPDWVLGSLTQTQGRQQWVLNVALPEVQSYLYNAITKLLDKYPIDYIKWDHNRVLPFADAAQTQALYLLLSRLRDDFPEVEIESCASGGGRIDYGILQYAQRVWLSDSNDALERLRIQHHSATFLPMLVTGSHVGPRHCHTSGRVHAMAFRAWVAAQRHMGIEMDPSELDTAETQTLTQVIAWWKANRCWLQQADLLRLDTQR